MPRWSWGTAGPPGSRVSAFASQDESREEPVALPTADETVSFAKHIKPLFRQRDRQSMKFAFDLWSYDEVGPRADDILERLYETKGTGDAAWRRKLSRESDRILQEEATANFRVAVVAGLDALQGHLSIQLAVLRDVDFP